MKISYVSLVCLLVTIFGFQGYTNAYLGCPKPSPCIYYTDNSAIKTIDVNASRYPTTKTQTIVNTPAYAIDIDMTADMIYWSEQWPSWKIRRMNLNNGSIEDLITKDLGEVEGISVDWINRNLYWTDLTYERIEVSTLDGLYRKTLFDKDDKSAGVKILNNPKGIAVHPTKGYVFWTDYHYYYPQLARSTLAGTDYRMIRDLYWTSQYSPTGLTIDFTENRLYLIEAHQGTIESFDLNGRNRIRHHTAGHDPYPNDMTLLGDLVYWADQISHSVESVNRTSWVRLIGFGWLGDRPVLGVVGYDASYQKPANTNCTNDNGKCSHLCLPTPTGRICACPNGVKLLSNNRDCSNVTSVVPPPQAPVVSVSLVNGRFPSEGRVEVTHQGLKGTVCDDYFGSAEAHVICRMLNYTRATHYFKRAYFGKGSGVIWLDSVKCKGNEKSISECQHAGWGENDCDHSEDIGVRCYNGTRPENVTSPYTNTTGLKVRLKGSVNEYEGRVEVYYQNDWGTICDWRWTLDDAHVVCRMLGYEGAWGAQGYAYFGKGTRKIMVSDVVCTGSESSIGLCYSSGWGNPTCSHNQDVSVTCKAHPSKFQDSRTLRLREGLTPNEGRVEIKHKGVWGTICDDAWDIRDAHVVCRQLGYPGALSAPIRAAFGQGSGNILLSLFGCSGVESSLQNCIHSEWGATLCVHSEDASVVCRTNDTLDPQADASSFLLVADEKRNFVRQIIHQVHNTNHSSSPYTIQGLTNPDFVAIDPAARSVYVTQGGTIYMSHLFHNITTRVVRQDQRISGLAVDYVCKKLYWSDYYGNRIMVSLLDGSSPRGLVTVDSPKGIVLDIRGGVMYYIGGPSSKKIYRSHMDGSNAKVLLTLTSSPTSIAHDRSNNIIYWSDTDKILYLNLSSNAASAQMLSSVHVSRPYGLTVHSGYLYWTDIKSGGFTGGLYRARLTSSSSHVTELVLSGFMTPRGVASLDLANVLPENFACRQCHKCQQICLRVPSGHRCMCSGMYHLATDNTTCVANDFFAFVDAYRETADFVPATPLDGNQQRQTISLKKSRFPRAVEWDPVEHRIYYADTLKSHIARVYLNGTGEEIIISDVNQPRGLAIDHVGRNLYFTDYSSYSISVCKLDGTYRKTLQVTQGNKPSAIAVYSETGYLYWGTWGDKSRIYRALMDGTEHTMLVQWIGTYESYGVSHMTIDKTTNRLYWVGWHEAYIEYIDLSKSTPMLTQVRKYANYLYMPEGIALTSSKLCWTDRNKGGMFCGNRNGSASVQSIVTGLLGIFGLKYCKGTPPSPSAHPCASDNNGQCSHLCLLKPNGYSCACPDMIPLNTTCSSGLPTTTTIPTTTKITTTPKVSTEMPTTPKVSTEMPTTPKISTEMPTTPKISTEMPTTPKVSTEMPTTPKIPSTPEKPTTTPSPQPTSKSHPSTSKDSCMSNPCLNGGTCQQGKGHSYQCSCPEYYVPKRSCKIFIGEGLVTMTINGISSEEVGDLILLLKEVLMQILNEQNNTARRRRSADNNSNIKADNIFIASSRKQDGNRMAVEVAVMYPSADGKITSGNIMPAQTLKQKIINSKPEINKKLQSKYRNATVSKVEATPRETSSRGRQTGSKTSKSTIAAVIVIVLLIIVIAIALLIYFSRKRLMRQSPKNDEAAVPNDFATFSNPGYGSEAEQSGNLPPPLTDSIAMSSNFNTGYDMEAASNPTYETKVENPGTEFNTKMETPINPYYDTPMKNPHIPHKEKKEPMEFTPEHEYAEISVRKDEEPAPETPPDQHQYDNIKWERFDEPEYENVSRGKLALKLDHSEDEATA